MEFSPGEALLTEKVTLEKGGEPGCVLEILAELDDGSRISYDWRAGSEVEFNIHTHSEKEVTYHEQSMEAQGKGSFLSSRKDHYYLMWLNRSQEPVEVSIQLRR